MTGQELTALAKEGALLPLISEAVLALKAERDALQAQVEQLQGQLEDERVWRRDAERVAAGGKCSCWLGRPGATFGLSAERMACAVHRDVEVEP